MHDVTTKENNKMSVFERTLLSLTNALLKRPRPKISGKRKGKTQRVSYKLTVIHHSRIWVKCLVDNARF